MPRRWPSTCCSTPDGCWLFFRFHKLGAAVAGAAALTLSSADLARRAADPRAGVALAPYLLWCAFATVLSTHIWRLNGSVQ